MTITVLAFAQAREYFGFSERIVDVATGATGEAVLDSLRSGWREALPTARLAIDLEYTTPDQVLRDGQTLAIIPPVSGG